MDLVTEYELRNGGIALDPTADPDTLRLYFSPRNSHTVSPAYLSAYSLKSHLVIRMLEMQTGKELLMKVNKPAPY